MIAAVRSCPSTGETLAALARDRAAAYGFLAAAFRSPGRDFASTLGEVDPAAAFEAAGLDHRARLLQALAARADPVELNIEHTRLFSGPRPAAPPFESVYRDPEGQVMGRATAAVIQAYEAAGLAHDPRVGELPDHVAVELEFLGVLCEEEAAAWAEGNALAAARYLERQQAFLGRHLLLWFPVFAARAVPAGPHPFYRTLLEVAGTFLARDEACLGGLRRFVAEEFGEAAAGVVTDA